MTPTLSLLGYIPPFKIRFQWFLFKNDLIAKTPAKDIDKR